MAVETAPRRMSVRRNDNVVVLAGKDKGRTGRVLRVIPAEGRVIVERVNFVRKHTKANPQKNIKGGSLAREASVDASNVMVICSECGKPSRIGRTILDDGKKVRSCRRCNGLLDK